MGRELGKGLRALVVHGDAGPRTALTRILAGAGLEVASADTLAAARVIAAGESIDLLIAAETLADGSGLELAREWRDEGGDAEILLTAARPELDAALEAMRLRVGGYVLVPFERPTQAREAVTRALERLHAARRGRELVADLREKNARLEDLVVRDGLTGLYNHMYFQDRLDAEIRRSERSGHQLALLFMDLDRFKAINDGVGHQVGDMMLRSIAHMLRGDGPDARPHFRLRKQDLLARYGGDEFVLLLPDTTKKGAAITADRLRRQIAAAGLGSPGQPVTISIGIASYPADGDSRQTLLHAADLALYEAKRLGRNKVVEYRPQLGADETARAGHTPPHGMPAAARPRKGALARTER